MLDLPEYHGLGKDNALFIVRPSSSAHLCVTPLPYSPQVISLPLDSHNLLLMAFSESSNLTLICSSHHSPNNLLKMWFWPWHYITQLFFKLYEKCKMIINILLRVCLPSSKFTSSSSPPALLVPFNSMKYSPFNFTLEQYPYG